MSNQAVGSEATNKEPELKLGRGKAYFWFSVLTVIYWFDIADRSAINAVFPAIKQEYGLSDTQLGLLISAFSVVAAGLAPPTAWLVDRWSRKYMIAIMTAVWSFFTWFTGQVNSFRWLLFARSGVGAAEAGYNAGGAALISAWFPQKIRGRMFGIFNMAQPLGSFLGMGLAGLLAVKFGWRSAFGILALPGLLLAVLILFAPDYKATKVDETGVKEVRPGIREVLRYTIHSPTLLLSYLAYAFSSAWYLGGYMTWTPTFFGRVYNMDMAEAGLVVVYIGLVAMIGPFLGGWFSDHLVKRTPNGRAWAGAVFMILSLIAWIFALVLAMQKADVLVVGGLWALGYLFMSGSWGMSTTIRAELSPPHFRGSVAGITGLVVLPFGIIMGPLSGALSDALGLTNALLIILVVFEGLTVLCFLAMAWLYHRDVAKLKALGVFELRQ